MEDFYANLQKKDPESLIKYDVYKVSALHLPPFPHFFKTLWIHRSNCIFCACDFTKKHIHWESLNPYENLLQIERSSRQFPQKCPNCAKKPDKTLIKLILFHRLAPAAETLIKLHENHAISSPPARAARRKTLGPGPRPERETHSERKLFFDVPRGGSDNNRKIKWSENVIFQNRKTLKMSRTYRWPELMINEKPYYDPDCTYGNRHRMGIPRSAVCSKLRIGNGMNIHLVRKLIYAWSNTAKPVILCVLTVLLDPHLTP